MPPINYSIIADYGKTIVIKLKDSKIEDVLGPTLWMCYKMYKLAPLNRMIIGKNLYDMINDSFEDDYRFTKIHEYPDKNAENSYPLSPKHISYPYSVYLVSSATS